MSRLTKRIRKDLGDIGDRATPSQDAWLRIQQRIQREGDNPEMEVVMIDTEEQRTSRGRRPLALAAAAAVLIVGIASAVMAIDDGGDDRVGVTGQPDDSIVDDGGDRSGSTDAPVTITVDGRSYVLTEPETCFQNSGDPETDGPLVHVIGRTEEGSRVELGFHHESDPSDPADAAGYTGRLSIQEGATASSWRPALTTEPWPYLSIGRTGVTGEVTMTDQTGRAVEVTLSVTCDS